MMSEAMEKPKICVGSGGVGYGGYFRSKVSQWKMTILMRNHPSKRSQFSTSKTHGSYLRGRIPSSVYVCALIFLFFLHKQTSFI